MRGFLLPKYIVVVTTEALCFFYSFLNSNYLSKTEPARVCESVSKMKQLNF